MRGSSFPLIHSFSLIADLASLAGGRELIRRAACEAGFPEQRVFDITVAASEAMANAIEHAVVRDFIQVSMFLHRDRFEVQVEGPGEFQAPSRLEEHSHRGLGLPLMAKLADHLALYSGPRGGTLVSLTFYRPGMEQERDETLPPRLRELVEENEFISAITENAPIGLYILDPDLRFRWSNPTYRSFLEEPYRSCELTGLHISEVQPGMEEAGLVAALENVSKTGRSILGDERQLVGGAPSPTWWRRNIVPLKGQRSEGPYHVLVVVSDESQRRQAETALQTSKRRAELLARTAERLLTSLDPQTLVEDLCREVMNELDCHVFFNFLVDDEGERLHLNAYAGISADEARAVEWLDYGAAVCGCAARDVCAIVVEDINKTSDARTELVKSYGIEAYACHPLIYAGTLLGTLSFGSRSRAHFSGADLSVMRAVADQVAVAMARIRTEQAMTESRRALERAQAVAKMGSWSLDTQRNRLLWSNETYRMFGLPVGTPLTFDSFLALVHPEDRDNVERAWAAALEGAPYDIEHRIVTSDGLKWVRETAELDFDSEGRVLGGFGIAQEITEGKQVEDALRLAVERQALAQRATRTGFWDWDVTTGRLSWSMELFDLFGLEPTSDPTFDMWLGAVHPEDRERALQNVNHSVETAQSLNHEFRVCLSDGQERWIGGIGDTTYGSDGKPLRMCGICIDITDRKRAEAEREQLLAHERVVASNAYARSLIEASLDPLVTISAEGKITDVNEATIKITGRAREELIGTDFSDYFTEPVRARQGYQEVFAKGSVTDYPLTIRDRNGKLTEVLYNASLFSDQRGNILGVFAAARDITAVKELEQQRRIASVLQDTLLDVPREPPGVRFGHLYRSATEGARIGGDFYDVFQVDGEHSVVLIGDVSGHGVEAARIATLVKDVVRAFSHKYRHPRHILRMTNDLLIDRKTPGFVTLFLGVISPRGGTLIYSSAGHPNALLRSSNGAVALLEAASAPLGVFASHSWKESKTSLSDEDLLFLYTDGAVEARRGDCFFGQEGLMEVLAGWSHPSPEHLPEAVLGEVLAFSGGKLADDVALLAIQLTKDASPTSAAGS